MKIVLGISKFVYPNKADDTQTEDEVCTHQANLHVVQGIYGM